MNSRHRSRLACVCFPHLGLALAWRAHPELRGEAVVLGPRSVSGREVVVAASAPALARGVRPGQGWRQAEIACPEAVRLSEDVAAIEELRREARLVLYGISPLVEWVDDSTAYLDISRGSLGLPTEAAVGAEIGRSIERVLSSAPSLGIGQSRFVAWAAAQRAGPGRMRLVATGQAVQFLSGWPVEQLPLEPTIVERLREFGLGSCGDCAAVPLGDLQRQFGPDGLRLHRLCSGQDEAMIDPWLEPPICGTRRVLAGVVADTETLRFGAPEVAAALAAELAVQRRAASRLRLLVGSEESSGPGARQDSWEEVRLRTPAYSAEELLPPVLGLLARVRQPVRVLELQALDLGAPPARQHQLWATAADHRPDIERAAARLQERFGGRLVWRVSIRPGHPGDVPEEQLSWRPA